MKNVMFGEFDLISDDEYWESFKIVGVYNHDIPFQKNIYKLNVLTSN